MSFILGLDLGQSRDYTALSVVEKIEKPNTENVYHIRHLERMRDIPYPDVVDKVFTMLQSSALKDDSSLVIDATGVGVPVVEMFRKAGLRPIAVWIHGGDNTSHEGNNWRVPKRDLVGILQVLLQSGRLKLSWKLKLTQALQGEMLNFRVRIDPATAHDSYSAWREADHDDLVLSAALALWWAESQPRRLDFSCMFTKAIAGGGPRWDSGMPDSTLSSKQLMIRRRMQEDAFRRSIMGDE